VIIYKKNIGYRVHLVELSDKINYNTILKEEYGLREVQCHKELGNMRAEIVSMDAEHLDKEAIKKAGEILKNGGLVAFPTETVYGLGGNALDPKASMKIYAAKGRPSDNPLIVHIADIEKLKEVTTEIPEGARILAEKYWPGPLTMILPKADIVPKETTGGLDSVAVRFPSDVIAQELIKAAGGFVAAPSANTSGRPSPTMAEHVEEDLGDAIDMILDGGQVGIGLESTIVDFTEKIPVVLRPGYISLEMLQETLGEVKMDKGLLITDSSVRPKAPGMKYRHYAPEADLSIVEGETEKVIAYINSRASEAEEQGKTVGIIATDETADLYKAGVVRSIGSRAEEETIAHHLYEVLRDFDGDGVSAIFSEAFYTPKMGQAIMNRLLKAAGHKIIKVQEEQK
jgi:L-threonylcarbamoyladenylate synthase